MLRAVNTVIAAAAKNISLEIEPTFRVRRECFPFDAFVSLCGCCSGMEEWG